MKHLYKSFYAGTLIAQINYKKEKMLVKEATIRSEASIGEIFYYVASKEAKA